MGDGVTLVGLAVLLIVGLAFIARAYAQIDARFVAEWSQAHALELTSANRPMVWWYLRNARVLRTVGVLAGMLLPTLGGLALGLGQANGIRVTFVWPFVGYLFAALYAELTLTRPMAASAGASLVPRILSDYLPSRLIWMQRVLGSTALLLTVIVVAVPLRPEASALRRSDLWFALPVAAAAVAVVLERIQSWVVQRPQPLVASDLVAADDAIRSQSVHSLSGSGMAIQLLAIAQLFVLLGDGQLPPLVRNVLVLVGATGYLAAICCCLYYGHRAWRVRRRQPSAVA